MSREEARPVLESSNEADKLRDRIVDVLQDGDHGLFCDSHYDGRPCSCWHAKISKIVGYES